MEARWPALVVVLVLMAGCGDEPSRPVAATPAAGAPAPLDQCRSTREGWEPLPTTGDYRPPAAHLGSGDVGVVFANDSDNDACAWSREARALADAG